MPEGEPPPETAASRRVLLRPSGTAHPADRQQPLTEPSVRWEDREQRPVDTEQTAGQ